MIEPGINPGTYALLMHVEENAPIRIGRLGLAIFMAGLYVYVGSARGAGGIRARLAHHFRDAKRRSPHWHVDWLRRSASVEGAWWFESSQPLECRWLQTLICLTNAEIPMIGFGASDCNQGCPAHLLFFGTMVTENQWSRTIEEIHSRLSDVIPGSRIHYWPGPIDKESGPSKPGDQ